MFTRIFFVNHFCPSKHGPKSVKQQNKWMVVHRKIFHHTLWTMVVNSFLSETAFQVIFVGKSIWGHSNDGLWSFFHFIQPAQQVTRCLTLLTTNELWVYQNPVQWVHRGPGFNTADARRKKAKNLLLSRQLVLVWCGRS